MNKYIYKDNRQGGKIVSVIYADDILLADKEFTAQTGIDPMKMSTIGCEIEFNCLTYSVKSVE